MGTNHRPMRLFRPALILCAVLCVASAAPLAAQQAPDSTRTAVTLSAQPAAHVAAVPAAQATSERFGRIGASATSSHASAAAAFDGGGSHTIVISTVTLLLIIIIILLIR
jgi:hypothetical protein